MQDRSGGLICLACAARLPEPLAEAGALRCHDCIDAETPLSQLLLRLQRRLARGKRLPRAA